MEVERAIREKLAVLGSEFLDLVNESRRHHRPEGAETHFKLLLVSSQFDGMSRLQRQQRVYELLKAEMSGPVHALTMKLFSPKEWAALPEADRKFRAIGHHPSGRVED